MANARRRTQRITTRSGTRSTALRSAGMETLATVPEVTEQERASRAMNWQVEYEYVKKDLRQLLLVSAFLFAFLFVVGFLL